MSTAAVYTITGGVPINMGIWIIRLFKQLALYCLIIIFFFYVRQKPLFNDRFQKRLTTLTVL